MTEEEKETLTAKTPGPEPAPVPPGEGPERMTRGQIRLLQFIILAGAAARLFTYIPGAVYPDSCTYMLLADNMLHGVFWVPSGSENYVYPLLYPFLTAIFYLVTPTVELAGFIVSFLCGVGLLVLLFLFARKVFGVRPALAATALAAVHPDLIRYSGELLTESTFLCVLVGAFLVTWEAGRRRRPLWWAAAGALAGLTFLARNVGLASVVAVAGYFAWISLAADRRREGVKAVVFCLIGFLILLLPHLLVVHGALGEWGVLGQPRDLTEAFFREKAGGAEGGSFYGNLFDPGSVVSYAGGFVEQFFLWNSPAALAFLFIGLLVVFREKRFRGPALYLAWWLVPLFGLTFLARSANTAGAVQRLSMPYIPVLLMIAGLTVEWPLAMARRTEGEKEGGAPAWLPTALILGMAVILAVVSIGRYRKLRGYYEEPATQYLMRFYADVARDLSSRLIGLEEGEKLVIMDRKPYIPYLMGYSFVALGGKDMENLLYIVDAEKVDLVIVDSMLVNRLAPQLSSLLTGEPPAPNWKLVYYKYENKVDKETGQPLINRAILVYAVEQPDGPSAVRRLHLPTHLLASGDYSMLLSVKRYLGNGEYASAEDLARQDLEQDPDNAEMQYLMSQILVRKALLIQQDVLVAAPLIRESRKHYDKAVELNPKLENLDFKRRLDAFLGDVERLQLSSPEGAAPGLSLPPAAKGAPATP